MFNRSGLNLILAPDLIARVSMNVQILTSSLRFFVLDVLKQFLTESETGQRWLYSRRHVRVSAGNYVITVTCISFGELGLENRI